MPGVESCGRVQLVEGQALEFGVGFIVVLLLLLVALDYSQQLPLSDRQGSYLLQIPVSDALLHANQVMVDRTRLTSFIRERSSLGMSHA